MRTVTVTTFGIIRVLFSADSALSAREIARRANFENTSENLRRIEDECWDLVEANAAIAFDARETPNGALFFEKLN